MCQNMTNALTDEPVLELSAGLGDRTFGYKNNVIKVWSDFFGNL